MVRCVISGAASRWFLLRGLVREALHWGDLPERFTARFPRSEVHLVDSPGNGRRYQEESPLSIRSNVETLRRELQSIVDKAPDVPTYLLAVSFGGMIAIDWIFRHPTDVCGAVLVNTSLSGASPLHHRLLPQAYWSFARIFAEKDPERREMLILELTSSLGAARRAEVARERASVYEQHPVARRNALRQLVAAARFRAPVGKPPVPVLILNSLGDRMVSPACSAALARAWDAPLLRHPTGGHDLPLDEPEWILDAIEGWKCP